VNSCFQPDWRFDEECSQDLALARFELLGVGAALTLDQGELVQVGLGLAQNRRLKASPIAPASSAPGSGALGIGRECHVLGLRRLLHPLRSSMCSKRLWRRLKRHVRHDPTRCGDMENLIVDTLDEENLPEPIQPNNFVRA
jgi:hypothetical protein